MALQKAAIMVTRGNNVTEKIDVLFNPTEYSIETSNEFSWDTVPGLSQPIAYFISGAVPTLTMDLFFDTYEKGTDVRAHTQKVAKLLDVDKDLHAPPLCKFVWGSLQFKGVLEQVTQKYTMFLDSGIPVRATLGVTFKAVASVKEQYQNIPRQSADRTKQKTVKQGDQLWRIAAEEYENPGLWREIAKANRIDDPTRLEPGSVLKIPRLH
ncbi:LysM peptidoglycan-binding domain-containing protein [Paenibacillus antri]|uniref:LysM peptidoglycan-binding domain-containing protein n=1 Tax=Paenibacillus antri TaxID=2582848 RepID=A0A5R9GP42_9BACL|nr:LysM peptidoglycan-binding domain-containing protein [Paenibacillus antri]TLS53975.1 LysM peptidoglycan-binding domain-containing protein [Paenibacillus antri]